MEESYEIYVACGPSPAFPLDTPYILPNLWLTLSWVLGTILFLFFTIDQGCIGVNFFPMQM